MCENLGMYLKGAESCPVNFTTFQERWNSGDDWTLLWKGSHLDLVCSILAPTNFLLQAQSDAKLYTNASTQQFESVGVLNDWGWAALSVSKAKNKIIYFRNGWWGERPFKNLDRCIMEGMIFGMIMNPRLVTQFFSVGELIDMHYKEKLIFEHYVGDDDVLPVQPDLDQFSKRYSLVFRPYTSSIVSLLPPVIWQSMDKAENKLECTPIMKAVVDMATRKRTNSFKCRFGGCEDTQLVSLKCHDSLENHDNHEVSHSRSKVSLQGQPGLAFDLSNLQHVVVRINDDLHSPLEMLDPHAKTVKVIFAFCIVPKDVVLMTITFDRNQNPIKGQFHYMVHTQPSRLYLPSAVMALSVFVVLLIEYGAKCLQRNGRLADIRGLAKQGVFGMTPSKNHKHLPEDLFCPDPIARTAFGPEQIFVIVTVAFAAFTTPYMLFRMSSLQKTLTTKVVHHTTDEFPLAERAAVLNEVLNGMDSVRQASALCNISGIALILALLSLSGFHLRTAVMVRSLKGSLSPLAHFMLIFCGAAILVACLMYWSLSAEHDEFSTPISTVNTQANFILGDRPHTDGGDASVNIIMHTFMTVFFMLILINMFLAIVMDSYGREMFRIDEVPVEYSLFYDIWLSLLDMWRFRWPNGKKWALAHLLSTTNSNARVLSLDECLLKAVGEDHPQVTMSGNSGYAFNDPVFGSFVFSESELRAYYRHIKSMDVLWPESSWVAENENADHGGVDVVPTAALPDDCPNLDEDGQEQLDACTGPTVVKPSLHGPSAAAAPASPRKRGSACSSTDVAPSTIGKKGSQCLAVTTPRAATSPTTVTASADHQSPAAAAAAAAGAASRAPAIGGAADVAHHTNYPSLSFDSI